MEANYRLLQACIAVGQALDQPWATEPIQLREELVDAYIVCVHIYRMGDDNEAANKAKMVYTAAARSWYPGGPDRINVRCSDTGERRSTFVGDTHRITLARYDELIEIHWEVEAKELGLVKFVIERDQQAWRLQDTTPTVNWQTLPDKSPLERPRRLLTELGLVAAAAA